MDALARARLMTHLDADDHPVFDEQVGDGGMGLDSSTMTLGVGGVRDTEPEGIDRAIGDPDCALYLACQIGFYLAGLLGSEFLGRNVIVPTALEFLLVVRVVVLLELDEQSTSSLDAVTRDIL